jgi:hypothetical protein
LIHIVLLLAGPPGCLSYGAILMIGSSSHSPSHPYVLL